MKTYLALLTVSLTLGGILHAQDGPAPSKTSIAYHSYRQEDTAPPFALAKIKALIAHIKPDRNSDSTVITDKQFNRLSVPEKFTYCMLNAENFDQNCDATPGYLGEENRIYGQPMRGFFDQYTWSARQHKFLQSHRTQVLSLIRSTIDQKKRVGANIKQAIIEINGYELIPDLISIYKRNRKDQDILSVCMLLMKHGGYKPFVQSATYRKLYSDEATSLTASVEANRANQDLEIARATAYYKSRRS